ncbi:MAG TPA: hypothetical protein VLQ48_06155 [Chloroflexia bacterium]|nr:hypothetical protein [Chloroflexia bacterium]
MHENPRELFIVFGGGCFGTHHTRHVEKGRARGRISPDARIIMVDRNAHPPALDLPEIADNPHLTFVQSDWLEYMQSAWDTLPPTAEAIPAPVAPHLAFEWLVWSVRQHLGGPTISIEPMSHEFGGLPYEYLAPSGARYISAADWICPTNCRAPHVCPMIRDVRTWELADTVNAYAQSHADSTAASIVFQPRFRVPGVDTLRISEYTGARDHLLALAAQPESAGKEVVIATCSSCHGAVSLLRVTSDQRLGVRG